MPEAKQPVSRKPAHEVLQDFLKKEQITLRGSPRWVQRDDGHWDTVLAFEAEYSQSSQAQSTKK
jgi:hypothetical protein